MKTITETNVTLPDAPPAETTTTPRRTRTIAPKVKKTGSDIAAEIAELQAKVTELESVVTTLDQSSIVFKLVDKELKAKRSELTDCQNTNYTFA